MNSLQYNELSREDITSLGASGGAASGGGGALGPTEVGALATRIIVDLLFDSDVDGKSMRDESGGGLSTDQAAKRQRKK